MTQRKAHNPAWPWTKDFRISQAVQVGDTIYVSGQGPLDSEGQLVGEDDMAAQSRQVFANIRAVLAEAGATMDDVSRSPRLSPTRAATPSTRALAPKPFPITPLPALP